MNAPLTDYQATIRRSELAIPLLIGFMILGGLALAAVLLWAHGQQMVSLILATAGVTVAGALSCMVIAFRVHRWTLKPDGIAIHERPKVPLTGLSHRAFVAFADIIAFRDVESGFDYLIEIVTRQGRRYRMAQKMVQKKGERLPMPDMEARLGDLVVSLRDAAARAGAPLPSTTQGLSFWNTIPGLAFIGFLLAVSLVISGVVVFALVHGFTTRQPRGGEAIAILLILPVGAFILLRKMLKRRWKVLETLRQAVPAGPIRR
ncbi:MAG: hypothetical protein K0S54_3269 [Alphaproteobacteria bacterium]|jgi:hypothetical protein|nr:hypothetical protein [Alphaproteobacteria bacterium]